LSALWNTHDSGNTSNIGINICQSLRRKSKKARTRLQNFNYRLLLIRDRGYHQIGPSAQNLLTLSGPGISHDDAAVRLVHGRGFAPSGRRSEERRVGKEGRVRGGGGV